MGTRNVKKGAKNCLLLVFLPIFRPIRSLHPKYFDNNISDLVEEALSFNLEHGSYVKIY